MWKLIYEDTFGFREERDPPRVECHGENDKEGFLQLWYYVLNETLTESSTGISEGFARFTLILTGSDGSISNIRIDAEKEINTLIKLKNSYTMKTLPQISSKHYEMFSENREEEFWLNLKNF